ncbi:hypothetical protein HN51_001083, partial [Arachis hypogaea]
MEAMGAIWKMFQPLPFFELSKTDGTVCVNLLVFSSFIYFELYCVCDRYKGIWNLTLGLDELNCRALFHDDDDPAVPLKLSIKAEHADRRFEEHNKDCDDGRSFGCSNEEFP